MYDYHTREADTKEFVDSVTPLISDYAADYIHNNFNALAALHQQPTIGIVAKIRLDQPFYHALMKVINMDMNEELMANMEKVGILVTFTINRNWTGPDDAVPPYISDSQIDIVYNDEYIDPIIASDSTNPEIETIWLGDVLAACITQDTSTPNISTSIYGGMSSDNASDCADCACDCGDCCDSAN